MMNGASAARWIARAQRPVQRQGIVHRPRRAFVVAVQKEQHRMRRACRAVRQLTHVGQSSSVDAPRSRIHYGDRSADRQRNRAYFFVGAGDAAAGAAGAAGAPVSSTLKVQFASTRLAPDFAATITVQLLSRSFCVT